VSTEYGSAQVVALEGLQPVRMRPGMYIGSTGKQGFHHLLWEVVDNSVDEAMAGHADRIEVTLNEDGSATVSDNGRGIPVEPQKAGSYKGMPTVVMVCTVLHAGGKFGTGAYTMSGGLHGVGISVVNALTRWMNITVRLDGKIHEVGFAAQDKVIKGKSVVEPGVLVSPLKSKRNPGKDEHGTTVTFLPDERVFSHNDWDVEVIARRLRQTAFLNPGLTCTLTDAEGNTQEFLFPGGISDFMKEVAAARLTATDHAGQVERLMPPKEPISLSGVEAEGEWVMAMQWHPDNKYQVLSFANGIETIDHGTHVEGYQSILTTIMTKYARQDHIGILTEKDSNFEASDVRSGLGVIISIKVAEPQFQGQTKGKLGNEEIKTLVRQGFNAQFWDWMQEHPTEIKAILTKAVNEMRMRKKLAELAEKERAKSGDGDAIAPRSQPLPAKLSDCESKDRKNTELFIVEGDSAAGPALMSRNPALQAVLPIRGKGLNVEKAIQARQSTRGDNRDRIANNVEVQSIIASVGAGSESKFDIEQSRFSKIVILTDADDDGAHIATLLLTTFYHLMRPMLEQGRIYVARPPLFSTIIKDEKVYAHTVEDRDRIDRESRAQLTWTRFKGLGEMNPDELGDTAINPATRRLAQISMTDVEDAAFTISQLMGKDPAPKWAELSTVTVSGEDSII